MNFEVQFPMYSNGTCTVRVMRWFLKGTRGQIFKKLWKYIRVGVYYTYLKNSFPIVVFMQTQKNKTNKKNPLSQPP